MILRPDAVVLDSGIRTGIEVCFSNGAIDAIRPWSSAVRKETGLILSPKFVNSHSHLEYYDLKDAISETAFWPWIAQLTERKHARDPSMVKDSIKAAARKNVATGVWAIGEWSDWDGSDNEMTDLALKGAIFQEIITIREWASPSEKLELTKEKTLANRLPTYVTPHAPYTVAPEIISKLAATGEPLSIHAAETDEENDFYLRGEGPIADLYKMAAIDFDVPGKTSIGYLDDLGALHRQTQLVHLCAATDEDIQLVAERGCKVAHCPRSNVALGCSVPQVGTMLDRGIRVGLGLDSAASSGEIDMFAEMRCALSLSNQSSRPLTAQEVWSMAISTEAVPTLGDNAIREGTKPHLMLIECAPNFPALVSCNPYHVRQVVREKIL